MSDILKRLDEYIEYAENTKRFADVGFYGELAARIQQLEQDKAILELAVHTTLANLNDDISRLREDKAEMLKCLTDAHSLLFHDMGDDAYDLIDKFIAGIG